MMSAGAGLPQGRVVDDVVTIVMRRHVRRSVHSGQCRRPQARCDGKINKNARAMMVGQSAAQWWGIVGVCLICRTNPEPRIKWQLLLGGLINEYGLAA
jgi:hypothetical protein